MSTSSPGANKAFVSFYAIQYSPGIRTAQVAIGAFARRWEHTYPKAVAFLLADEEELLSFFQIKEPSFVVPDTHDQCHWAKVSGG